MYHCSRRARNQLFWLLRWFSDKQKNNIYLGAVSRVEPSLQAAFIEFGSEKKAFLPFDEIHPSYFKIPHNEKILENGSQKNNEIDDEKENKINKNLNEELDSDIAVF